MLNRREFIASLGVGAGALLACGADRPASQIVELSSGGGSARLQARPATPTVAITPGTWPITSTPRDGSLVVPSTYSASRPMPMVLALHGAGGTASGPIALLGELAESVGFCLLAVTSRGPTWDGITGQFGRDIAYLDTALKWAFARCAVDPARMCVEGFSDGASYALSLAQANGDLFPRAVAFSPGFIPAFSSGLVGKAEFFVSHGRQDPILNIDQASRRIVPSLRSDGYQVLYSEFDGGHTVPAETALAAAQWMVR
jgi:poly(3-hydroxybutyrate) depolymerase